MADRSDESDREEATYGRSGNPQERQQSHGQNQPWRASQGYQQGQQYGRDLGMQRGGQGLGQRGSGGQGFGEFGERSQGWESERGSDFYGGLGFNPRGQGLSQGSPGYGPGAQGYGQGSERSFRGIGPKNYTRSDERICDDVCERLTQDDDLDASEIEIRAEQGVVTLEGTVEERWMKHRAEDIAESCSGVREVENRIRVQSGAGRGRSGSEALGRSGSQGEVRSQSSTRGSSGTSGSTPH